MAWNPKSTDSQDWDERGLREAADVDAGAWLLEGIGKFGSGVAALIPRIFPSYARIFHPARSIDDEPVTWSAVARANGRIAHPAMEWGSIVGSWQASEQEGVWHDSPMQGSLPVGTTRALADTLRRFTQAPAQCWFGHWEGSGYIDVPSNELRLPMPSRNMVLFAGGIDLADTQFGASARFPSVMSAHLWWPDDQAWCVATDIDLMTTYVGASTSCIDALLTNAELEALPVPVTQRLTWDTDTVNPLPACP
ncbi:hypothetical protein QNA19_17075 [Rhodococcus fascians]|jgi:hypothetical protein|nr:MULTISPECIES: hypothetical protein [Rhodococcus]MDJ0427646.1 hypothetical protein [Rhodococcus fascians]OZE26703.1 hypothetical protein CH278_26770 [Rhodococcus sp. 05-2254-5]OZE52683.1 hypothetical protein CH269_22660 [Rhodococcus sp. 05-2254-1]WQH27073.1 hypothetical protein U2G91_18570 [Rhodococcus fascians]